jgi:hypothetical protein
MTIAPLEMVGEVVTIGETECAYVKYDSDSETVKVSMLVILILVVLISKETYDTACEPINNRCRSRTRLWRCRTVNIRDTTVSGVCSKSALIF